MNTEEAKKFADKVSKMTHQQVNDALHELHLHNEPWTRGKGFKIKESILKMKQAQYIDWLNKEKGNGK